ncbi:hypothetical protein B0J13DRAFT_31938 [Dactylonectria estremocensis]|uniref:Major facilitator superfamily transporter n=1 Tax=Dactylonectria estremocensis TaxID=1079267 RepID=A0A9P9FID2_9HYPO|nr:hypothetical protein B0J13DRAFT_31938 [Dactylonectria estremocensis]
MGLLPKNLRTREPPLPLYHKLETPSKERFSDDDSSDYTSDEDEPYSAGSSSQGSSRSTSASASSGLLKLPRQATRPPPTRRIANVYPYRLPAKVTRYLFCTVIGFIVIMILSLIRASQVENWKLANGKVESRPPPPPMWEKFPFLERYYGGIDTLTPVNENKPEYPYVENEATLLEEAAEEKAQEEVSEQVGDHVDAETQQADGGVQADSEKENTPSKRHVSESLNWNGYAGRNAETDIQECFIDADGVVRVPELQYYNGRPKGFPEHVIGSYEVLSLPEDICFDRFGRYGPYGFGYSERNGGLSVGEHGEKNGSEAVWTKTPRVDYRQVNWADVQRRCYRRNAHRYNKVPHKSSAPHGFYIHESHTTSEHIVARDVQESNTSKSAKATTIAAKKTTATAKVTTTAEVKPSSTASPTDEEKVVVEKKSRTAVVVRCWDEYFWREDDIVNLRSMIAELALGSGGRYDIHLLVQVKNDADHPIWADEDVYRERIEDVIPEEFRGIVTLWTETQMLSLYQGIYDLFSRGPELPVHGVYRGLSMAMQYFAYMHPEYDHFWQWEMDVRYTGHYYDLFTKIEDFAKAQPRKGLWDRNARFYFPSVHGTWDDFSQMSRVQSEMGVVGADDVWKNVPGMDDKAAAKSKGNAQAVWGPVRAQDDDDWFEPGNDPVAPIAYEKDHYQWGVGEEADYISLNPIFDPEGTTWGLKDDITGFNRSEGPPPRRANIITTSRMSRRLLLTMHKMTALKKQFAFPEMWPATVALQHGYKAVFAPHPVYVDRAWPLGYMAQMFNNGRDGASGGSRTSIFGDREHNMHGLSWFYNSGFAPNVYRRWLGLKVNNDGGDEFETTEDQSRKGKGVSNMRGGEGRMCLPPMLLHPIKDVELPVEAPEPPKEGQSEAPVSDPSA